MLSFPACDLVILLLLGNLGILGISKYLAAALIEPAAKLIYYLLLNTKFAKGLQFYMRYECDTASDPLGTELVIVPSRSYAQPEQNPLA